MKIMNKGKVKIGKMPSRFDDSIAIGYPSRDGWAALYRRLQPALVNSLSKGYSYADREDAVEEAFNKLMHKKNVEAYGDKVPQTEADWFWQLHWQARSFLSHLKDHAKCHAKYIERASKEMFGMIAAVQGLDLDRAVYRNALAKALEIFRREQDISRRNICIYMRVAIRNESAQSVGRLFNVTENHVYQIKFRIKNLLRKHGIDCLRRALR